MNFFKLLLLGPLALLFDSDGKEKSEKKALKEVTKLNDQVELMNIAKMTQYKSVRAAAIEKITDPALIGELANSPSFHYISELEPSIAKIADQKILLDIAKKAKSNEMQMLAVKNLMKLCETAGIDEHEWLTIIRSLESSIINEKFSPIINKLFSKVRTPSVLLEYTPPKQSKLFNGCYLSRVIELADGNPDVFMQFQAKAATIIRDSHTDEMGAPRRVHDDAKQSVPGTSSDCHNDSIPWKRSGHGYHKDGYFEVEPRHIDTIFFNKFKPYFDE